MLIPETVKRGAIEIGRFEITRAQFAAFDKDYKFDAGTENYPANGITLELAQAYCKWLSELTAETYRLPKEAELATLYKNRSGENTLDYWAGYALNPEDARNSKPRSRNCREMRRCCAKWEVLRPRARKARNLSSISAEMWRSGLSPGRFGQGAGRQRRPPCGYESAISRSRSALHRISRGAHCSAADQRLREAVPHQCSGEPAQVTENRSCELRLRTIQQRGSGARKHPDWLLRQLSRRPTLHA